MEHARKDAKAALHALVASKFKKEISRNSEWFADAALKDQIVSFLNGAIDENDELRAIYRAGRRDGITAKWLAYAANRNGIASAVQTLKRK